MSNSFRVGDHVWIKPKQSGEFHLPWAGKILSEGKNGIRIEDDSGKIDTIKPENIIKYVNTQDVNSVEDMINLSDLKECSILRNLLLRYRYHNIYTYIGGILVALNPYELLPIYSDGNMSKYHNRRIGELPPHIFAIGAQALTDMKRYGGNQCVIISGETGAGKTESTKFLLGFLANVSSKSNIGEQIVQANPILEAFGNAKTTKNDNSSRFGKYIEISYNKDSIITGACIQHYLLEKSRIKSQNLGDRNYHIFYYLIEGLSEAEKINLKLNGNSNKYVYLKQGGDFTKAHNKNASAELSCLKKAMALLNFKEEDIVHIFKILSSILHIGNFIYVSKCDENKDRTEIQRSDSLESVINLLGLVEEKLKHVLTHSTITVEGKKLVSEILLRQALSKRDAFAIELYSRLFSYVLTTVNKSVSNHQNVKTSTIGILDIFGFENFKSNSFEQLCINYANEKLQQFFVKHIFKIEQDEYRSEGIDWEDLEYKDNQSVVELLGGHIINVMSLVDEQTRVPKPSDISLLIELNRKFSGNAHFVKAKSEVDIFGVKHYAGTVTYNVEGFIEKNTMLGRDWLEIIRESTNPFLKSIFASDLSVAVRSSGKTLSAQYCKSLEALMKTLGLCQPFFIRCIKPNNDKKALTFEHMLVCQQLQYSGMMETAKIRRCGFPIRHTYYQFILRYRILLPGCPPVKETTDLKAVALQICSKSLNANEYRLGKTKIFLKIPDEVLELLREEVLTKNAIVFQKNYKSHLYRKRFLQLKQATVVVQSYWRAKKPRNAYIEIRTGYLRLQACLRSRQLRKIFRAARLNAISLQARCRGFLLRKKLKNMKTERKEVLNIQTNTLPLSKSGSLHDIDSWISNVFDNAVGEETSLFNVDCNFGSIDVQEILDNPQAVSFQKYARANFMGNVDSNHTKKKLSQPLLDLESPADQFASLAIWETILRFMGDTPVQAYRPSSNPSKSIISQLYATISQSFLHSKEFIDAYNKLQEEENNAMDSVLHDGPNKLIDLTIAHKKKLENEVSRCQKELNELRDSYDKWLKDIDSSLLEKLHFIIGHGILRPALRDEIYCQLCKQLSNNPCPNSSQYGWILLALCASCFTPVRFASSLFHFMATNGNKLGCIMTLQRTFQNGSRNEPPTSFELNAMKTKKPMEIRVNLLDGTALNIQIDPATTAKEVCSKVISNCKLKDDFGFSLFIIMFGKTISMESDSYHVLDGVSQCESLAKERGIPESEAPWNFRFAKEMFSPWQTLIEDIVAADLIYSQVIRGSCLGLYRCSQEGELAQLVAQHYFVNCGKAMQPDILSNIIIEVIPEPILKQKGVLYWVKIVTETFNKGYYNKLKIPEVDVKLDVVTFAKEKWPILFSKYYEVTQLSGIAFGVKNLLLAINSDGIFIAENSTKILMKITYLEIAIIDHKTTLDGEGQLHILTLADVKFVFKTKQCEIISSLVNWILTKLISNSIYVVAIQQYSAPDSSFLPLTEGDLVILEEAAMVNAGMGSWFKGYKIATDHIGEFPASVVQILPTLSKPPNYILDYYKKKTDPKKYFTQRTILPKKHTLEVYASRYFRSNRASRHMLKKSGETIAWKHSKTLIWEPLHKGLEQYSETATSMFKAILQYTGDRDAGNNPRHTRPIFEPALQQVVLRDELFCQIMKQITENPDQIVEQRAWQLMWLATGLFPSSGLLLQDLKRFLETRAVLVAQESLRRLEKVKEKGERLLTHHWIEIDAIQKDTAILHKVSFPNGMEQIFKIDSFTTGEDLIRYIGAYLGLKSVEGFSLILSFDNSAISLPSQEYLFDAILNACNFPQSASGEETPRYVYDLVFVKKLWMNTYAGVDQVADLVCHYNQELAKYMAGSSNRTPLNQVIDVAVQIFIAENMHETGNPKEEILNKLVHLIPRHMLEDLSAGEWVKNIFLKYLKQKHVSDSEAKINFLKIAQTWDSFGSAFFLVHRSSSMQDDQLTLAVNRNGIYIVDRYTMETLASHKYSEVISSTCTSTSLTLALTIGTYSWWTRAANKISDLINSYLDAYDTNAYYSTQS